MYQTSEKNLKMLKFKEDKLDALLQMANSNFGKVTVTLQKTIATTTSKMWNGIQRHCAIRGKQVRQTKTHCGMNINYL